MQFTLEHFVNVSGIDLGGYVKALLDDRTVTEGDLQSLLRRTSDMDTEHLEALVVLIGKSGCQGSQHMVADFLNHQAASVRLIAIRFIIDMASVDYRIMSKIVSVLSTKVGEYGVCNLETMLSRPADDKARLIAESFLKQHLVQGS